MPRSLTDHQKTALCIIAKSVLANGYALSQRDIAVELGCSQQAVRQTILQLEDKGYVKMHPYAKVNGIRVLRDASGNPVKLQFVKQEPSV